MRNIVTDITDSYYVGITVVTMYSNKNMRNYVTKLLCETKRNRNYVTLWRIRNQEVKIGVYMVENTL
jgi:hypothetical protein